MAYTFNEHWITETLRLRESLWGPLEDSAEAGRARAQGGSFDARLLTRSRLLARRERLDDALERWRRIARLVLMLFALAAILAGGAVAAGALGSGGRPVNLAVAVTALLGLNTISFLLWAASFGMQAGAAGSLLTDAWLKLTRKLAKGPDAALLPRALLELTARQRASRWAAGVLSHWLWLLALLSAFATLLALLATRRYTFQWETTVLSPDTFVTMVKTLGWLPSILGFPQPSADTIRASDGLQDLPESAHALWSVWLLGVMVIYGLIPRFAALTLSAIMMRRRMSRLAINPSLPGIAELRDRLMPASVNTGTDAPAPSPDSAFIQRPAPGRQWGRRRLLGIELPDDLPWPPQTIPPGIDDLGVIDTREQRHRVLDAMREAPAERLLVCCDARQTPDRGAIALLAELASLTSDIRLALLPDNRSAGSGRSLQWREQLMRSGFTAEQLSASVPTALEWLSTEADPSSQPPTPTAFRGQGEPHAGQGEEPA